MNDLSGFEMVASLIVAAACGGGMFFVLRKFLTRLRQIEDELFGKPISPDTVLAFVRQLFKKEEDTTGVDA
ncbi:MAG: hypothetical protein OSB41_04255 [Kiritimatiellae bacterium]|nr:hypothetical protein [Kiritimatiellia bacterium]